LKAPSLNPPFDRVVAFRANYAEFTFPIVGIARRVSHVSVNYVHPKV